MNLFKSEPFGLDAKGDVTANFKGAGVVVGSLPGQSVPDWLYVTAPSTAASPAKFTFSASASRDPGVYKTTMRFVTGNADLTGQAYVDLPVTYVIGPRLPADPQPISAVVGGSPVLKQVALDTGNLAWKVSSDAAWLTTNQIPVSGSTAVMLRADPAGLAEGDYTGTITLEDSVAANRKTIKAQLRVDKPRLMVRRKGVALSLIGSYAKLKDSIEITDNGTATPIQWSASSDSAWLRLGQMSGRSGDHLALEADTTSLPDGMHIATVSLKPLDGGPQVDTRVGVYVDRGATFAPTLKITGTADFTGMVADPVRPFVYLFGFGGKVQIYNVATGALAGTITVPNADLTSLAASFDGRTLYALDVLSGKIYPLNLDTQTVGAPLANTVPDASHTYISYSELNGKPILVTNFVRVMDAVSGAILGQRQMPSDFGSARIVARRDGKGAFLQSRSLGNHYLGQIALSQTSTGVAIDIMYQMLETGEGTGLVMSWNDDRVFTSITNGSGSVGFAYVASSMAPIGKLPASPDGGNHIAVAPNGTSYVPQSFYGKLLAFSNSYAPMTPYTPADYTSYDRMNAVAVSGDGGRVIASGWNVLYIVNTQ